MTIDEIGYPPELRAKIEAPTADTLNAHLRAGGIVQVSTYLRSTVYRRKHAGMFRQLDDGALAVQRGRSWDRLSAPNGTTLVSIRLGHLS